MKKRAVNTFILFSITCVLVFWMPPSTIAKEKVVFGLSQNQVSITPNFSGTEIIVYGAIDRTNLDKSITAPLDIIITLSSIPKSISVRKKTPVFNVWTNTQVMDRVFAPDYYSVLSTRPIKDILTPEQDKLFSIQIENTIYMPNHQKYITFDTNAFRDALIRLRRQSDLYREAFDGVIITEGALFQARLQLPDNIVSGDYRVRIFLVKNKRVQDVLISDIYVRKAGLERILHELAHDKPLQYGLISVFYALVVGWLAFKVFYVRR
jgi:uncharacterized protein (TIGR02186 family)